MLLVSYKHRLELPNSPLQNTRGNVVFGTAPHFSNELSISCGKLSFCSQWVACVNLWNERLAEEVFSQVVNRSDALDPRVHEARVSKVGQSHPSLLGKLCNRFIFFLFRGLSISIASSLVRVLIFVLALFGAVTRIHARAEYFQVSIGFTVITFTMKRGVLSEEDPILLLLLELEHDQIIGRKL